MILRFKHDNLSNLQVAYLLCKSNLKVNDYFMKSSRHTHTHTYRQMPTFIYRVSQKKCDLRFNAPRGL